MSVVNKSIHVVTVMLVYLGMLLGCGYYGIEKICGSLSLKHFTNVAYLCYAKFITAQAKGNVKDILEMSRKAVIQYYSELGREPDDNGILGLDVTFDGSWHTRGHKSLFGVGVVIDANTQLILDYETLCKMCAKCNVKRSAMEKKKMTEVKYENWKKRSCPIL